MDTPASNALRHSAKERSYRSTLLEAMFDILEATRTERHQSQSENQRTEICSGEETDSGSGESSDEAEDESVNRREAVEDLQVELARLEISEEASTLETLILIVEFYVKSRDVEGFQKNVRRPDKFLLSKPRPNITDLQKMAENMERQNLPFRAVMLHKAIATLFKYEYKRHPDDHDLRADAVTPDKAVSGILISIERVFDLRKLLQNDDAISLYLIHYIPIMYDMLTNLREIRHANRKLRANCESWGLLHIGLIHGILNEDVEMRNVIKSCLSVLERRFKKNAKNVMVNGVSYLALGMAQVLLGEDASENVALGIKSLQECTEFGTWDAKVKVVTKAQDFANLISTCV